MSVPFTKTSQINSVYFSWIQVKVKWYLTGTQLLVTSDWESCKKIDNFYIAVSLNRAEHLRPKTQQAERLLFKQFA